MTDLHIIADQTISLPPAPSRARHFIDGRAQESADGRRSGRLAPWHGVLVRHATQGFDIEAEAAIKAARAAFDDGRRSRLSGKARAAVLNRVVDLIMANVEKLALIERLESGTPISQARVECGRGGRSVARCGDTCPHQPWRQSQHHGCRRTGLDAGSTDRRGFDLHALEAVRDPLPEAALCARSGLHMRSETVGNGAFDHGNAGRDAGGSRPAAECVHIVPGYGTPAGSLMTTHPDVDMVTFTGSTAVGKRITERAGETLKEVTMALGGKDIVAQTWAEASVLSGMDFDFAINMEKAAAFDPGTEERIRP